MRQYNVELRVDLPKEKEEIMRKAARTAAKHLFTTAMLLSDGQRKPQIVLRSGDMFESETEISLADDLTEE